MSKPHTIADFSLLQIIVAGSVLMGLILMGLGVSVIFSGILRDKDRYFLPQQMLYRENPPQPSPLPPTLLHRFSRELRPQPAL